MLDRDDPVRLLGQDHESVVAMLADASVRGDAMQLAEARAMFELVSSRADVMLPPTSARFTATLMIGPVAALAHSTRQIDDALKVAHAWMTERPTPTLRSLGRALGPLDSAIDDLRTGRTTMDEAGQADVGARWERLFLQASVLLVLGRSTCRIVACDDELQIRVQDPETGVYLAFGHLPFDPEDDHDQIDPRPRLAA